MPSWVILPQLFLAAGWMRAGIANAMTGEWWNGESLRRFVETDTDHAIVIYNGFLTHVVEPHAGLVAVFVCTVELAIGALLALNRWTLGALLTGAFLNVQFMLAGVVNPSAFYLVLAMIIMLWRLDAAASPRRRRIIGRRVAASAGVTTMALAPFATTVDPAQVIEDPAIVLIFLSVLFALAMGWASLRPAHEQPVNHPGDSAADS